MRSCVSCGSKRPKAELSRFVWFNDELTSDPGQKANGRGAYSCNNDECSKVFYSDRKRWKRAFRLS